MPAELPGNTIIAAVVRGIILRAYKHGWFAQVCMPAGLPGNTIIAAAVEGSIRCCCSGVQTADIN